MASELDFFNMEKEKMTKKPPIFQRRKSFRDIQEVISKINPEILKSVIASVSSPEQTQIIIPKLPICDSTLRLSCDYEKNGEIDPMTIFYNGTATVFEVSPHKAREILNFVEKCRRLQMCANSNLYNKENLLESLNGDLPIARKQSLQRFLEKRRERLAMVSPYEL